jgi:hypothetical protein
MGLLVVASVDSSMCLHIVCVWCVIAHCEELSSRSATMFQLQIMCMLSVSRSNYQQASTRTPPPLAASLDSWHTVLLRSVAFLVCTNQHCISLDFTR